MLTDCGRTLVVHYQDINRHLKHRCNVLLPENRSQIQNGSQDQYLQSPGGSHRASIRCTFVQTVINRRKTLAVIRDTASSTSSELIHEMEPVEKTEPPDGVP